MNVIGRLIDSLNMATQSDPSVVEDEQDEVVAPKEKKHNSGSADLEKVTDFEEEKELDPSRLASVFGPATTCPSLFCRP